MAFPQQTLHSFTKQDVLSLNLNQCGVYGIFNQLRWVYIGKGDIRERLLAHLNGDIPAILAAGPTHWVGEVCGILAMDVREKQLILECSPHCNQRIG
jgi:hypothetical protein